MQQPRLPLKRIDPGDLLTSSSEGAPGQSSEPGDQTKGFKTPEVHEYDL